MALQKEIELNSGVVVNYHRIEHYIMAINNYVWVEVKSYISADKRQEEIATLQLDDENSWWDGFVSSRCYELPYKENMTIQEIYDELKKQPEYEGATDC